MIIVKLMGGLGNQMFQYAYAKQVAQKTGLPVKLDATAYEKKDYLAIQNDTKRSFLLSKFNTTLLLATEDEVQKLNPVWRKALRKMINKIRRVNNYAYRASEISPTDGSYRTGFWQNEKYFAEIADEIRNEFRLKNPLSSAAALMHEQIKASSNPISLHIRRGDYVTSALTNKFFGAMGVDYYKEALGHIVNRIGNQCTVFIFSDDIEWARQASSQFVPAGAETVYVSNTAILPDYEELALMSACQHHVIANSSFSWWGAWLNPNTDKIVIAPKQWIADPKVDTSDVTPKSWVRM